MDSEELKTFVLLKYGSTLSDLAKNYDNLPAQVRINYHKIVTEIIIKFSDGLICDEEFSQQLYDSFVDELIKWESWQ